jgi:hypothetical protein
VKSAIERHHAARPRRGLPYVVLLDADSGGRGLSKELERMGIPKQNIVRLETVFVNMPNDFAIEDILSPDFYERAVKEAYPANPVSRPGGSNKKRATMYEEEFRKTHKIGFNKRRVAEAARKLLAAGSEDDETSKNLGILSGRLIEALKAQIPASTPPGTAGAEQK